MQDTKQITTALIELYDESDWIMNLNFKVMLHLSGMTALPKNANLLDCGCATGQFIHQLQQYGFTNVSGIDASVEMVAHARQLTKTSIQCLDVLHMSEKFERETFDAITAMNLQHHLGHENEWETFIRECRKIIRLNGILFVREPYSTFSFNALSKMSAHPFFFRFKLLKSRLQSLVEEKILLDYFMKKWPGYYRNSLKRNGFEILKDFCWMGHRIVVSQAQA